MLTRSLSVTIFFAISAVFCFASAEVDLTREDLSQVTLAYQRAFFNNQVNLMDAQNCSQTTVNYDVNDDGPTVAIKSYSDQSESCVALRSRFATTAYAVLSERAMNTNRNQAIKNQYDIENARLRNLQDRD